MKKLFLLALISLFVLGACGKKAEEPAANDAKPEAAADAKAGDAAGEEAKADDAKADEADPFAGMDKKKYDEAVKGMTNEERNAFELKALKHSDPQIRRLPMVNMTYNLEKGSKSEKADALLYILQNETDPEVLTTALRSNMNNLTVSNDFYEAYKKHAASDNADIRMAAMYGIINSNNHSVEGIEDEGIKFLDDKDARISSGACKELLSNKYTSAMPKIEEIMKSSTDEVMLETCAKGLMDLWYYAPFFKEFDAKAYQLTLDYLKKTPRTKNLPGWSIISTLTKAPKDEWKELAKEFNAKDLVAALSEIVKDDVAGKLSREYSIKAIAVHGTKADLEALDKAVTDENVKKEIAKAMETAK
ncbi:MAG: hypothetical protein IJM59_07725 [Proteobacteria bacterium]|nr:hypothetical protein [Pseudomonadota bacterium]